MMSTSSAWSVSRLSEINEGSFQSRPVSPVISVKDVTLAYGSGRQSKEVLSGISLDIAEGDFVAVLGASGSGKTSLLRLLAGYERPTSGQVTILGESLPRPRPEVGVVFQQSNLFPWLTIRRNAEFGLLMKGIGKAERRSIASEAISGVGLGEYGSFLPYQLSGGMKQRAAIARTLAASPRIILMDEPFGALDAITREHLQTLVKSLWQAQKRTFFFITHDVDEALYLGTRIIVLNGSSGRIGIDRPNPFPQSHASVALLRQHAHYAAERQLLLDALESD